MDEDNIERITLLLKDSENIPEAIRLQKFMNVRAQEIENIENYICRQTGTKLVFQRLPKHLRRRTMSHNIKRLPRKYREIYLNQMTKSGLPPKSKRPSRKYRRRPKNLLEEYNRRQKKFCWLETHIWHAKRFHMVNRWGYSLPERPCDKSFRACFRASSQNCLLQDISYFGLIELSGPEEVLINSLLRVTSKNCGLTIAAKAFSNGKREGEVMFYHANKYPYEGIGRVQYMWKPPESSDQQKYIWFWVHAAFYDEIATCLKELFNLRIIQTFAPCEPTFMNNSNQVCLKKFKTYFNRFRLTGPVSHSIIKNTFQIVSESNTTNWFQNYLQIDSNRQSYNDQVTFWKYLQSINSQTELSPHLIFNLTVTDPRFTFPKNRTKSIIEDSFEQDEIVETIPENIKNGAIWLHYVRSEVSKNIKSTSEFLKEQQNNIAPAENTLIEAKAFPIMLVQQPGNRENHLGYGSGWDIICPLNLGLPIWLTLIMHGARAGGMREFESLNYEQGSQNFLQPDTQIGQIEENRISELHTQRFFKLPPKKRINYNKLKIVTPFKHHWEILIQDWSNEKLNKVDKFYVLRDKKILKCLQDLLNNKKINLNSINIDFNKPCIIPVKLNFIKKGISKKYSIICLPEETDLKNNIEPIEPLHKDENQKIRKNLRNQHRNLLKKLKRKRIRDKANGQEVESNKQILTDYAEKMRKLWLPAVTTIKNSCSRQIFGFVTKGNFSYSIGKGQNIGYITLNSLPAILEKNIKQKNFVLIRDTNSRQYRFAKMEIICT